MNDRWIFVKYHNSVTQIIHHSFSSSAGYNPSNYDFNSPNVLGYVITDKKMDIKLQSGDYPEIKQLSDNLYVVNEGGYEERYVDIESGLAWDNIEAAENWIENGGDVEILEVVEINTCSSDLCPDCKVYCEKRFIDGRCE